MSSKKRCVLLVIRDIFNVFVETNDQIEVVKNFFLFVHELTNCFENRNLKKNRLFLAFLIDQQKGFKKQSSASFVLAFRSFTLEKAVPDGSVSVVAFVQAHKKDDNDELGNLWSCTVVIEYGTGLFISFVTFHA